MSDDATHARLPVGAAYREDAALRWMLWGYAAFWLALAIAPLDRPTWLLENGLVFATVALAAGTYRRFPLSLPSYSLLCAFFLLHAVGSHYTYSAVPLGDWVRDAFELERNHYDRVVHFAFGLLFAYPLRELCLRVVAPLLCPVIQRAALSLGLGGLHIVYFFRADWGKAKTPPPP